MLVPKFDGKDKTNDQTLDFNQICKESFSIFLCDNSSITFITYQSGVDVNNFKNVLRLSSLCLPLPAPKVCVAIVKIVHRCRPKFKDKSIFTRENIGFPPRCPSNANSQHLLPNRVKILPTPSSN